MEVKDKIRFLIAGMLALPHGSVEQIVMIGRMLPYKVTIVNDIAYVYNIHNTIIYTLSVTDIDLSALCGNEIYLHTEQCTMFTGRVTIRRDNIRLTVSLDNYINTLCMLFKINDVSYDLIALIQNNNVYFRVLKSIIKEEQRMLVDKQSKCKSCNIAKVVSGAITLTHNMLDPVNHVNRWSRSNIRIETVKNLYIQVWYVTLVKKLSSAIYLYRKGE